MAGMFNRIWLLTFCFCVRAFFHVQERLLGASEEALEEFFLALDEDLKAKNFSWTAKGKQAQLVVIYDFRFVFRPEKVEWQMFVFFLILALL